MAAEAVVALVFCQSAPGPEPFTEGQAMLAALESNWTLRAQRRGGPMATSSVLTTFAVWMKEQFGVFAPASR
jgi:hypothetical protein